MFAKLTPEQQIDTLKLYFCKNTAATDAELHQRLKEFKQRLAAKKKVNQSVPVYKTKDGAEINISKIEPTGIVTIAGKPAPQGEIVLNDGTKVKVGVNGVIAAVELSPQAKAKQKPVAPAKASQVAPPKPAPKNEKVTPGLVIQRMKKERESRFDRFAAATRSLFKK